MTGAELAAHDAAARVRTLEHALTEERRGRAIRAAQGGRTDAIDRNIARLITERDAAAEIAAQSCAAPA